MNTDSAPAGVILPYLEGQGRDRSGRTLAEVLAYDDVTLESRHDFIQWLFPLTEPSGAVPGSPVLDDEEVTAIRRSDLAQTNIAAAAARLLSFYRDTEAWLEGYDHNHLRITRIIKSLRLLVGHDEADAFKHDIRELADSREAHINATTLRYWREA